MSDPMTPDKSEDLQAYANETQDVPTAECVIFISISHPSKSWTATATFHLFDPAVTIDPDALNGPTWDQMQRFLDVMTDLEP